MTDEMVDVVDENDNVIGIAPKDEANNNPLLIHRTVSVIIFDEQNRLLVQQRSLKKKVRPGTWSMSCAGHVMAGEDPLVAVHRELLEELGFDLEVKLVKRYVVRAPKESHMSYIFKAKYQGEKFLLNKDEVEQVKFIAKSELEDLQKQGLTSVATFEEIMEFWK